MAGHRRFVVQFVLFLLAASISQALAGCGPRSSGGKIGIPSKGNVRILARRIKSDSKTVQWLWTVVGDRNWVTATQNGDTFELSSSYPLNSTSQGGGTHVWECTLVVRVSADGSGQPNSSARLDKRLRGSNSTVVDGSTTVDLQGGALPDAVHITQSNDEVVRVPAELKLATIGARNFILKIEP